MKHNSCLYVVSQNKKHYEFMLYKTKSIKFVAITIF